MNRKTLTILIISFVVGLIIFGLWFFFFIKPQQVPTTNNDNATPQNFFPVTTTFTPDETPTDATLIQENKNIPRLRQISKVPTAGAVAFEHKAVLPESLLESTSTPKEITETVFRYVERSTGHLYETTERSLTQKRLSNVTIPKIQDAFFDNTGNNVILRYLDASDDSIETFLAKLVIATTTESSEMIGKLEGTYMDPNITNLSTNGSSIVYVQETNTGGLVYTTNFNKATPTLMYESSLKNILLERPNQSLITITTKADSRVPGFMFFLNQNKSIKNILTKIPGLMTNTSPDGNRVLVAGSQDGNIKSFVLDVVKNTTQTMSVDVIPEKCVWSKTDKDIIYCSASDSVFGNNYPQSWYQGKSSFKDSLWKINLTDDNYEMLIDLEQEVGQEFDVIKPILSPNDEYLLFINKNDLTLWSFDLKS